jgi:hypothetical protein
VLTARHLTIFCLLLASIPAQAGSEFFCCQDANGRRACGDTLPEICRAKAYQIIDGSGNVVKEVGPPLTPEQKKEALLLEKRRQEQEQLIRQQRLKDQALLETYSSLGDIDLAQKQAEINLQRSIEATDAQIQVINEQRKKFEREAEFYKKHAMPPEVAKGLRDTDFNLKLLAETRAAKQREFQAMTSKFDEERKRYLEIINKPGRRQAR